MLQIGTGECNIKRLIPRAVSSCNNKTISLNWLQWTSWHCQLASQLPLPLFPFKWLKFFSPQSTPSIQPRSPAAATTKRCWLTHLAWGCIFHTGLSLSLRSAMIGSHGWSVWTTSSSSSSCRRCLFFFLLWQRTWHLQYRSTLTIEGLWMVLKLLIIVINFDLKANTRHHIVLHFWIW